MRTRTNEKIRKIARVLTEYAIVFVFSVRIG